MQQLSELEGNFKKISEFENRYSDIKELFELAVIENDHEVLNSCKVEIQELFLRLEDEEFKLQFNGKADDKSCYLEIHAGAGGTESQDWAQMLTRMYLRWAEKNNFKTNYYDIDMLYPSDDEIRELISENDDLKIF